MPPSLTALPLELLLDVLTSLTTVDLSRLDRVSRLFHAVLPQRECSLVEEALRNYLCRRARSKRN